MADIVPDLKVFKQTSMVLPLKEYTELSKVGQSYSSNSPKKELTWLALTSLNLGLDFPTLEHDVLKKVNISGCAEWDSTDQQEAREILREYADVFAKNNLDLG